MTLLCTAASNESCGLEQVAVCADGQQSCLSWMHGDVGKHWNASLYSPAAVRGVDAHLLPVYTEVLSFRLGWT